jgi:hypothetical protein
MKHRIIRFLACALSCAVFSIPAVAGGPYLLRLGLQPGKTYLYSEKSHMNVTVEMMGQEMKSKSTLSGLGRYAVEAAGADRIAVVASSDSMTFTTKNVRVDTTESAAEIVGRRTRFEYSPLGKLLRKGIIDTIPTARNPMPGVAARDGMRVHQFQEAPIPLGGTWSGVIVDTVSAMGNTTVTTSHVVYTLVGEEVRAGRMCVKVTYVGTMSIEGKGVRMGADVFTEGKGTQNGTLYFDSVAGVVVEDTANIGAELTLAVTGTQNMTVPMSTAGSSSWVLRSIQDTQ